MSLEGRCVGEYQVVAELGRGQRAVVYRAWQRSLERHVALKVLKDSEPATLRKLEVEAQRTAQLIQQEVPNLRKVYEVGRSEDGYAYVALECVDDSLRNRLCMERERNRRYSPEAAVRLLRPVAEALDAMHRLGWVHLDIKPQNILISRGGRTLLADLGIMERVGAVTHACTPAYASPEQAGRRRPVGAYSDVYSLGVVLYEMLTGRLPFQAEHELAVLNQHLEANPASPRKLNPRLGVRQERAVLKALSKHPEHRQQTACELLEEVAPYRATVAAIKGKPGESPGRIAMLSAPMRRRMVLTGLVILVIALGFLVGLWLLPRLQGEGPTSTAEMVTGVATPGRSPGAEPATPASTLSPRQTPRVIVPTRITVEVGDTATLAPTHTPSGRPIATPSVPAGDTAKPSSSKEPIGMGA